jgi:acyl dehydratase
MSERMIGGPWFEDFTVGDDMSDVPAVTVTEGYAALHQAIFGDRLRLPLDRELCTRVTGESRLLVNPALVCNLAIGQSTVPSQRVMGNLFYRGLRLHRPVFIDDTLTTRTRIVALRQNKIRPGRAASGMVALEVDVRNQQGETVMMFWRCPMVPCREPSADTGHNDDFSMMSEDISDLDLAESAPDWNLDGFADFGGLHFADLAAGDRFIIESRDTVTSAPELVRMTLNMAMTHTDAGSSVYGRRLVYGGHTIATAAAQLSRALPNLVSVLAWRKCDHVAPVFENDILAARVTVSGTTPVATGGGLVDLNVTVDADRGHSEPGQGSETTPEESEDVRVLDWHLVALVG